MVEDPRLVTQEYLEQHKLPQLLEALTAQLMVHKPDNPKEFIVQSLEKIKLNGMQPLFKIEDLHTMFGMYDLTHRGTITSEQANSALRSALGQDASLESVGVEKGSVLTRDEFTKAMQAALEASVPYKN